MAESAEPVRSRRRWVRWTLLGGGGLVLLLVLLVGLAPTLLSTGPGTRFVLSQVNGMIPGTIEVDDLSLGWFSGQEATGVRLLDAEGSTVADVQRVGLADASLIGLLTGGYDLGAIAVERPVLDVVQDEQGVTNLERALGVDAPETPSNETPSNEPSDQPGLIPTDLSLTLALTSGEVKYRAPQLEPVTITIPQVNLAMPRPQEISFDADATVVQAGDRGSLSAKGRLDRLFDEQGRLNFTAADVDAQANVTDLPLAVVDRVAAMEVKSVAALLGPTLTAQASAKGTSSDMAVRLVANAEHAQADVDAKVTPDAVRTSQTSTAQLTLEPDAFAQWTGSPATLLAPVQIRVSIADLIAPLRDGQPVLNQATGRVALEMDDAQLDVPSVGNVTIRGTSANAAMQDGQATIDASTTITQDGSAGTLALRGSASDLFNAAGEFNTQIAAVDLTLTADALPLDAIDRIAGLEGQLADVLGPTLQVEAVARGRMENLDASLQARSANLAADLGVTATPERIAGRNGGVGQVRLTLPADVASRLLAPAEGSDAAAMTVRQPVAMTLRIGELAVPMQDGTPQPMQARANATVAIEPTTLDVPDLGTVRLSDVSAEIQTPGLAERLQVRAGARTQIGQDAGQLALRADITNLLDGAGELATDAANIDATLSATELPVAVVDQLAGQDGLLVALLGDRLQVDATMQGQLANFGADVTARSPQMSADLHLTATPDRITGRDDGAGQVRLTVTPAAAQQLQSGDGEKILPQGPVNLSLQLPTLAVPMRDGSPDLAQAQVDARLAIEPVTLLVPDVGQVQLDAATAALQSQRLADGLDAQINARTTAAGQAGTLGATARVTQLVAPDGSLQSDAHVAQYTLQARDLPILALLDPVLGQEGLLLAAAGPSVTADARGTWRAADGGGPIEATVVAGPNRIELAGLVQANQIAIDRANANVTVTPALFRKLMAPAPATTTPPAVDLAQPAKLSLTVDRAVLPTDLDPARTALSARLTAEPFVFQPTGGSTPITLSNLALTIAAPALNQPVRITAQGDLPVAANVVSQPAPATPGGATSAGLRSTTTLNLAFDDKQQLDLSHTRVTTDTAISRFPVALIDQFAQAEVRLVPILGPVASLNLKGDYPGPINLQAQSATAQARVVGDVRPEPLTDAQRAAGQEPRILLDLREDLTAQLSITPEMVAELIGKMHPMFQDAVASESPVRLVVSQGSGDIPLTGLDLSTIRLSGVLDAGRVRMRRGGWLQETISVVTGQLNQMLGFNRDTRRNLQVDTYVATFTPMNFSLQDGVLNLPETWVTSRDLAIGFVGSVDLTDPAAPRIRQMVMGVLEASLIVEAPRLAEYIQADQIAELPLSGLLSAPKTNYDTLVKDLVGSGIVQTARERGGEIGAILGGIFEGVGQAARRDRAQRTGVTWNPPQAALDLVARARQINAPAAQQPAGSQGQTPAQQQPAQQPKPQQPRTPGDLLRELLGQ